MTTSYKTFYESQNTDPVLRLADYVDYKASDLYKQLDEYGKESSESNTVPLLYILGQSNAVGTGITTDVPTIENYTWKPIITPAKDGFTVKSNGTVIAYNAAEVSPIAQSPPIAQVLQPAPVRIYVKPMATVNAADLSDHAVNGSWQDYDGTNMSMAATGKHGVEFSIAYYWATKIYPIIKKPLHIIKSAVGGVFLGQQSSSPGINTNWTTDSNQLWDVFFNYTHKPALLELMTSGLKPSCIGMFWMQGESDANATLAPLYEANLRSLINDRFRTTLGFPNMNIYIMGLSNYTYTNINPDDWNRVKFAQIAVCEGPNKIANCTLIRTDGTDGMPPCQRWLDPPTHLNSIHYSSLGLAQISAKLLKLLELNGDTYTTTNTFEMIAPCLNIGENPDNFGIVSPPSSTGLVGIADCLHEDGVISRSLSWFNDPSVTARTVFNSQPAPRFSLKAFDGAVNQEFIIKLGYRRADVDTTLQTSVALVLRAKLLSNNLGYASGWFVFFSKNTVQLWPLPLSSSVVNSGDLDTLLSPDSIAVGQSIYYKIRLVDNVITVWVSRTIKTADWVQAITYTDNGTPTKFTSSASGGQTFLDLNTGLFRTTDMLGSTAVFDVIVGNKL